MAQADLGLVTMLLPQLSRNHYVLLIISLLGNWLWPSEFKVNVAKAALLASAAGGPFSSS